MNTPRVVRGTRPLERFAWRLRCLADRIDRAHAPLRLSNWSFTFERNVGVVFHEDGRGCALWYLGETDYERAHIESLVPGPWIDWSTMTLRRP